MRKRTKYIIGGGLFALSLLIGILGCVQRTGTFYCDTSLSVKVGVETLSNGASFFGEGDHHSVLSVSLGTFMTLRAVLFSWWWDTFCIPYDIYLRFDGVNFYVYDQDGKPIPDVLIRASGQDSFFELEKKTDENGWFYYPRRDKSFSKLIATKEGYWGCCPGGVWLKQTVNSGLPPMLSAEFRGHAIEIPTTNGMDTLNIFMKKIPRTLPVVDSYDLVVSNVVSGVEYEIDLCNAELCPPFGNGKTADMKIVVSSEGITMRHGYSDVLNISGDECENWPYLYYVPPMETFDKDVESDVAKPPVLVRMHRQEIEDTCYVIIQSAWTNKHRQQGDPSCIYLKYFYMSAPGNGVLVCDYWSRRVKKMLVPAISSLVGGTDVVARKIPCYDLNTSKYRDGWDQNDDVYQQK